MSRVICLDYGDKNIGVAVSDLLGMTAQAVTVIRRDNENVVKVVLKQLAELIDEYGAREIVLGYPRNMDGSEGFRCEKTREFKARLERRFDIPVILWDERLSTAGAQRNLAHLTREKRKSIIDKMAAVFILQGYLDYMYLQQNLQMKKEKEYTNMSDNEKNENLNEFDEEFDDAYESVTLVDEDGTESEYLIVDSIEDDGISYFLLIAEEDEDNETADAIILKEIEENGEMVMRELEDAEFDRISTLFESSNEDYELEV